MGVYNAINDDGNDYSGQYVAMMSMLHKDVIAHGDDFKKVYDEAKTRGAVDPMVFYVPSTPFFASVF